MPRDRKGRFTAKRTTTITTESLTIGEHPHHGNDTTAGLTPIFDNLLAKWPSAGFAATETHRAATGDASRLEAITRTIPADDVAWTRSEVHIRQFSAPYPDLDEDTLAAAFEPLAPLPDTAP